MIRHHQASPDSHQSVVSHRNYFRAHHSLGMQPPALETILVIHQIADSEQRRQTAGGPLSKMAPRYNLKPTVTTSRGNVVKPYALKVVGTDHWRAAFDIDAPGERQIDLRCFLRLNGKTLTETWLYQFFPPA